VDGIDFTRQRLIIWRDVQKSADFTILS